MIVLGNYKACCKAEAAVYKAAASFLITHFFDCTQMNPILIGGLPYRICFISNILDHAFSNSSASSARTSSSDKPVHSLTVSASSPLRRKFRAI